MSPSKIKTERTGILLAEKQIVFCDRAVFYINILCFMVFTYLNYRKI
jgi:hypothetical protein